MELDFCFDMFKRELNALLVLLAILLRLFPSFKSNSLNVPCLSVFLPVSLSRERALGNYYTNTWWQTELELLSYSAIVSFRGIVEPASIVGESEAEAVQPDERGLDFASGWRENDSLAVVS